MNKREKSTENLERITPNQKLKHYMYEKYQLEKKKQKADNGGGESLTHEERKRLNTIRNNKKRMLEDIIFPSMANLIFFFESIYQEPILKETFEKKDDIQELLGIRRKGPSPSNYGIFFTRLLQAILQFKSKEYDQKDFRLRLMHEAHRIITSQMMITAIPPMYEKLHGSSYVIKNIDQDMVRALGWTEMISKDVEDPYDFSILHKDPDLGKQRERLLKHFEIEAPNRTLDIDTKQILKRGY